MTRPPKQFGVTSVKFNSFAPGRYEWNFTEVIFMLILVIAGWGISGEIVIRLISQDLADNKSILVQVMAWCRQATSQYLIQCWSRSVSPYADSTPQWLKNLNDWNRSRNSQQCFRPPHTQTWFDKKTCIPVFLNNKYVQSSVHENHRTCQTFPMARPKCLMRDFTNLNRIHKAHRTNVWWIMKVFRVHCQRGAQLPEYARWGVWGFVMP